MFNNEVRLIGWLEISSIQQRRDANGQLIPVIQGYIHTDKAYFGGKHPVLIKGGPASIVIEAAKQIDGNGLVLVFAVGKLRSSTDDRSWVIPHYIKILDMNVGAEYPIPAPDQDVPQIIEFLP